jgi:transposase InsO family protein
MVNEKRVGRLMGLMDLEAIYPKPHLSRPAKWSEKYPYLLRGLAIKKPDHVWAADITYIRLAKGFVYLAAVMEMRKGSISPWITGCWPANIETGTSPYRAEIFFQSRRCAAQIFNFYSSKIDDFCLDNGDHIRKYSHSWRQKNEKALSGHSSLLALIYSNFPQCLF